MRLRMVGPRTDVDPRLEAHANIEWIGPVDYARLPAQAAQATVLVMPYADLPVTRAMQPLKLKEYLATGLPVVATPLPATRDWSDALDLTSDAREFARLSLERSQAPLPARQTEARLRLREESWSQKARLFEDALLKHAPQEGS
jgi:glycosyltransferase involved in cell wall biosynthesis